MRIRCHRSIYVDLGTERYPLQGVREMAQDIAAKNISGWKTDYFIYFVLAT
jgi:hypothetical protein